MMHYSKGENVEKETTKEEVIQMFEDCMPKHHNFLWMHVKGGTRVENVVSYAKNVLDKGDYRCLVWSGNGGGVVKTISCAEIMKRKFHLYQLTRMSYSTVEEHWLPQMPGLEEIIAKREIPSIHIFMSLDPIDDSIEGVQKSNEKSSYWNDQYIQTGSKSGSDRYKKQIEKSGSKDDQQNENKDDQRLQNKKKKFIKRERKQIPQDDNSEAQADEDKKQYQENKGKKFHKKPNWAYRQGKGQRHGDEQRPGQGQSEVEDKKKDPSQDKPCTSQQALQQNHQNEEPTPHPRSNSWQNKNQFSKPHHSAKKLKPKMKPSNQSIPSQPIANPEHQSPQNIISNETKQQQSTANPHSPMES